MRDCIEAEARLKMAAQMNPNQQANIASFDPVPDITRRHFEEALKSARKSVTAVDLNKFEQFKKKFDPSFASSSVGGSGPKINWPSSSGAVLNNSSQMRNEDDDLYN